MVRLRLPGGRLSARTLRRLSDLAGEYGNGVLQLTSRAGLQLRGLPDPLPPAFVEAVAATGLLPSPTHERVRNIVASPLTGLHGGRADVSGLTRALDASLIAEPELAELPGRFLFVLDDGRGDVLDLRLDLGYRASGAEGGYVLVGGPDLGVPVTTDEIVPTLVRLALDFARARAATGAWHVRELPSWIAALDLVPVPPARDVGEAGTPLGAVGVAASVAVPLAMLTAAQVALVERVLADGFVVVTPWRGLVLPGRRPRCRRWPTPAWWSTTRALGPAQRLRGSARLCAQPGRHHGPGRRRWSAWTEPCRALICRAANDAVGHRPVITSTWSLPTLAEAVRSVGGPR